MRLHRRFFRICKRPAAHGEMSFRVFQASDGSDRNFFNVNVLPDGAREKPDCFLNDCGEFHKTRPKRRICTTAYEEPNRDVFTIGPLPEGSRVILV